MPSPALEHRRAEMIEEDERPDHARLRRRQRAMHLKAAEIDRARHDDLLDRVARARIAVDGVLAGKKAHGAALRAMRRDGGASSNHSNRDGTVTIRAPPASRYPG